jgi:hypothetical protein
LKRGPSFDQIVRFLEGGRDVQRLEEEFSTLRLLGDHRRFVVARMGSTGSTWLAKLLNSHLDVFCTHEQVLSRVDSCDSVSSGAKCNLVRDIATITHHGAYKAAGDVGSVWIPHAVALKGKFTTALLLRHPARLLSTRLRVYPNDQSYTQVHQQNLDMIRQLWDIDADGLDAMDRVFVQDLFIFASQSYAVSKIDMIVRIEDLADPDYCQEFLRTLSGVRYDTALVARCVAQRVNQRNDKATIREIVNRFTPNQRHWFRRMLDDIAPVWDYSLDEDVTRAPLSLSKRLRSYIGAKLWR